MLPKICSIPECAKSSFCKGMCHFHYRDSFPPCSIEDCSKPRKSHGYCAMHVNRFKLYGDANFTKVPRLDDSERFLSRINKTASCWEWTGSLSRAGYGRFSQGGKNKEAHRVSYEIHKGPIPEGLFIDHVCHNPSCVNPNHLRTATPKQNIENFGGHRVNNKSGVRGVHWSKHHKKWRADVAHNHKKYHVGLFDDIEEARVAVIAKRNELHSYNNLDRS